jgi:argininosuccinate lyase
MSDKLWGGRFEAAPDQDFFQFNRSFDFDRRLLKSDLEASAAHAAVLKEAGILTADEEKKLRASLEKILLRVAEKPELLADPKIEDVHSFIETQLIAELGPLGKKIHTGRSRNDQVATALRVWLRDQSRACRRDLKGTLDALLTIAEKNQDLVMPAYTHLQRAQMVLWPHWVLAYAEMLFRDQERLQDLEKRLNVLPLGSGALAGSGYPLKREIAAKELGFDSVSANSLDAVSDRDFVIEWMSFASLLMIHLSRLSEDLILYASQEFAFVELGDEVSSGSSLMPHKKNPDALELIRGKAGRVIGLTTGLMTTMKGLPTAYNKDLQEDKEALFNAVDTTRACLRNMSLVLKHTRPSRERLSSTLSMGFMNATELADLCVEAGLPFREAHERVGQLVRKAAVMGLALEKLPSAEVEKILQLKLDLTSSLSPEACLSRKNLVGGTAPAQVAAALIQARKKLATI